MKNLITTLYLLFSTITLYPQIGGYALNFDGTDDYVSTNYNTQINIFTIECWVKGNSAPSYSTDGTGVVHRNHNYQINWNHPSPDFRGAAAINVGGTWHNASFGPLTGNVWYHLAATYDGENLRAYKNGVLMNTNTNPSGNPDNISENLTLGSHSDPSSGRYFGGMIDEVRIWDVVLTADEIKANMYKEISTHSNLKVYYKMSNGSGTTLTDNSGNNVSGTLTNGPTWLASGSFAGSRQALDFDGTNDYVAMPQSFNDGFDNLQHFSFCGWVFCADLEPAGAWGTLFSTFGTDSRVIIAQMPDGYGGGKDDIFFSVDNRSGGMTYAEAYTENNVLKTGVWQHLSFVYDGTKETNSEKIKFYVDGVLQPLNFAGYTFPSAFPNNTTSGFVGSNNQQYDPFKGGRFDEFSFWNKSLTQSEIHEIMFRSLAGNETDLFAYYRFDQYEGTSLYDYSGNNRNGTLTNMDPATDWVASTAFNTWIGSESSTWSTAKNWSNGTTPVSTDNIGLYKWALGNETDITGAPTVNNLLFSSTASPTLGSDFTVNRNLILGKNTDLNGRSIKLGTYSSPGFLVEGDYRFFGSTGTISVESTWDNFSGINVGGLGAVISCNTSIMRTIVRGHTEFTNESNKSILRYYKIFEEAKENTDEIEFTLKFNYLESELNGLTESNLTLFKSTDNGNTWTSAGGVPDYGNNNITLTGITDIYGIWTIGNSASPLPVELSSLTAKVLDNSVIISWKTSTEVNNYGFEVERSLKTESDMVGGSQNPEWDKIGFVPGAGNSNSPKEYSFTDDLNDASLQSQNHKIRYRLKQIDNDGTFSYSKEVEIENLLPSAFELSQNYPNPFNPSTTIRFGLPADTRVTLEVFNIIGEKVATLLNNEIKSAGYYDVLFKASELSSGVYFYRLTAGEFISTKKLNIIK